MQCTSYISCLYSGISALSAGLHEAELICRKNYGLIVQEAAAGTASKFEAHDGRPMTKLLYC